MERVVLIEISLISFLLRYSWSPLCFPLCLVFVILNFVLLVWRLSLVQTALHLRNGVRETYLLNCFSNTSPLPLPPAFPCYLIFAIHFQYTLLGVLAPFPCGNTLLKIGSGYFFSGSVSFIKNFNQQQVFKSYSPFNTEGSLFLLFLCLKIKKIFQNIWY